MQNILNISTILFSCAELSGTADKFVWVEVLLHRRTFEVGCSCHFLLKQHLKTKVNFDTKIKLTPKHFKSKEANFYFISESIVNLNVRCRTKRTSVISNQPVWIFPPM